MNKTPVPQRKTSIFEYKPLPIDYTQYSNVAYAKVSRGPIEVSNQVKQVVEGASVKDTEKKYPLYLVRGFILGLAATFIGAIFLLVTLFLNSEALKMGGAIVLALGSVTVVMTLLRGQDLDEQIG